MLDPAFFPALQTALPMTVVYIRHRDDGWVPHVLIAESALLRRARAPPGLGVYALRRFKGPRELTTPRARRIEGDAIGSYGGAVVRHAPTQQQADAAANELVRDGSEYLLTMRLPHHAGWFVVDGAQQPVLPLMHRVNDSRGTPLLPRCTVSEYGLFRAARDIPALDWTRPLRDQAVSELSFDYSDDYWRARVGTAGSATMGAPLDVGDVASLLDRLALDAKDASCAVASDGPQDRRRSLRGGLARAVALPTPNLPAVVMDDGDGHLVYANLEPESEDASLVALRRRLLELQPTERVLERLSPINRGRILVEITDAAALNLFRAWLDAAMVASPALRRMLERLGPRILLLGGQFIVPRVTEYDRSIAPQTPHSDVDVTGEVVAIAIHVRGGELGTLIARGDGSFGRANASVFAYDTGATHYGPGVPHVPPPYPRYFTDRVFFLLCSATLDPGRIARHRRDNGLVGGANMPIERDDR